MFNILFTTAEDWPAAGTQYSVSRVFEQTEPYLVNRFTGADRLPKFDLLRELPTVFARESVGGVVPPARVGNIHSARVVGAEVHLEYSFDPAIPPIPGELLRRSGAQIGVRVFTRSHWAVHDFDLYRFLARNHRPARRLPAAFDVASPEAIDRDLVSVMMPFDGRFDQTYRKIREVAEAIGMECRRADNIWEHNTVIQDVISLIDRSAIVVCDCTGKNANVFYEAGIAHAFGREVVLITQNPDDIPFDLRHHRYLQYLGNTEGVQRLGEELSPRLVDLRARV
jgi:hypothetical protein